MTWKGGVAEQEDGMTRAFGWDLGGANVKLARIDGGRVVHVAQIPCPIIA